MVALRLHERLSTLAPVSDSLFNWADAVVLMFDDLAFPPQRMGLNGYPVLRDCARLASGHVRAA